jgi:hypothetical protein
MQWLGMSLLLATLAASAQGQSSVTLAWDSSPGTNISGYKLYYGATSRAYTNTVTVGNTTTATISNLIAGATYYFAATAYDTSNLESDFSGEVSYTNAVLAPPAIALTSPANGAVYTAPATLTLAASVSANGHTISQVQFYNGATLLGTDASAPYSFSWNNVSVGSYTLSAKAVYDSGSAIASSSVGVSVAPVTAVVSLWPSTAVPAVVDDGADSAVELGVKFRSDVAGSITGIRFYKASANTGTHVGNLWTSAGTLLATATFTGETASGWQQVNFATPVSIAANTVYVASYHANGGHYSADGNYFLTKGVDTPPLHALTNGVSGGNGVYAYGSSSAFPSQTWIACNYWVDVVWRAQLPSSLTSIAVTPANPAILAGATQQFAATGTYSDGSTQNLTSQATWTSSNAAVATVSASGLATAVSAGTTTLSAALNNVVGTSTLTVTANSSSPAITLTSPSNGASYAAPASINLAASVTANGHTITKVQFFNGASLLAEDASAPYASVWTNVSAGSYRLAARAIYDAGSTVDSAPGSLTVTGSTATNLPAPWQTVDIGSVGAAGSASVSGGGYTVAGAGNISGSADNFRFVYQPLSGDGEIKARLNSVGSTGTSGRIGVAIRESLTSASKNAFMGISPDGTFRWQRRASTGGTTSSTTSGTGTPPNAWARLVRTNGMFYGYKSVNGTNWTLVRSRSITIATNIYVGLAVASGTSNVLNSSTFTNVTVIP